MNELPENAIVFDTSAQTDYLWDNLIIEKRVSLNWLAKIIKVSWLGSLWLLMSSPVSGEEMKQASW
jgi:hypothetical protein